MSNSSLHDTFGKARWTTVTQQLNYSAAETCYFVQGTRANGSTVIEGFTEKGGIAVIANQLECVALTLLYARRELFKDAPDGFVVNGTLVSALTGLQSILDCIATFCQHYEPDDALNDAKIYFTSYSFIGVRVNFMQQVRRELLHLQFNGQNYNDLANMCKHTSPWLGSVSTSDKTGLNDVYDDQGRGAFNDMIAPLYIGLSGALGRLGNLYHQPVNLTKV